jgi:hypothetical protein
MHSSAESVPKFIYSVPVPSVSRSIALAAAAFFLCMFAFFPLTLGLTRTAESITNDPLLWLLLAAMFGSPVAFFLALAFPPKNWHARIESSSEGIRYIPTPVRRWMGEPESEVPVTSDVREILICRGSQDSHDSYGSFFLGTRPQECRYGFRILLRSDDGHIRELKVPTADRVNARQAAALNNGITESTGLRVHLVKREFSDTGALREVSWTPVTRSVHLGGFAKLAIVATPFIGGITIGIVHANGLSVVAVGICLWLLQTLAAYFYASISHQWSKFAALYWLTTTVSFAGSYAATFFFTAILLHSR